MPPGCNPFVALGLNISHWGQEEEEKGLKSNQTNPEKVQRDC